MSDEPTRVDATAAAALAGPLARSEDDLDPLVGTMVGGFRIDAVLGRGGMGVVYRAWDTRLDRAVALKTVRLDSKTALARFRREAKAHAKLRHRNVVPVHLIDEQHGLTYLVMDLVDGGSLRDLLATEKRLSEARALAIVDGIAAALAAAHERGLVHRDVKPSNVLLERDEHALLADFGLARDVTPPDEGPLSRGAPRSLRTVGAVGTPAYLAPEQLRGEAVDHRADIYALGVTLYELVTGARPLPAVATREEYTRPSPPSAHAPTLTPVLDALVLRMLAFDPSERFATYGELRAAIAEARRGSAPAAHPLFRAGATVIDMLVLVVLVSVATSMLDVSLRTHGALAWAAVSLLAAALEASVGSTVGKRLFGMKLISARGERVAVARAFVRNAIKWSPLYAPLLVNDVAHRLAAPLLFALALADALPLLGRHAAMLHDLVTNTRVVRPSRAKS